MAERGGLFEATAMPDRDWWQALWTDPAAVLRSIGIAPGMIVIDLCCGDGFFTAPLSHLVNGHVYGVDLDPAMLTQTQQELQRVGAPPCHLVEGDAFGLAALVPEKVDYVLLANTFHGVPDKTALAKVVRLALKDSGCFGIINWYPKISRGNAGPRQATRARDRAEDVPGAGMQSR